MSYETFVTSGLGGGYYGHKSPRAGLRRGGQTLFRRFFGQPRQNLAGWDDLGLSQGVCMKPIGLCFLFALAASTNIHAQTYSVLSTFSSSSSPGPSAPAFPGVVAQGRDGNLYSTTMRGGINQASISGTIFQVTPAGALKVVYGFNLVSTGNPYAPASGLTFWGQTDSSMVAGLQTEAIAKIDAHLATLTKDVATAQGEASLRLACLGPLQALREQVLKQQSLAHITQAENQAVKEFDAAVGRIENWLVEQRKPKDDGFGSVSPSPVVKKQRIIKPTEIMKATYLETPEDVNDFLTTLRQELEQALANNERIQIR